MGILAKYNHYKFLDRLFPPKIILSSVKVCPVYLGKGDTSAPEPRVPLRSDPLRKDL